MRFFLSNDVTMVGFLQKNFVSMTLFSYTPAPRPTPLDVAIAINSCVVATPFCKVRARSSFRECSSELLNYIASSRNFLVYFLQKFYFTQIIEV